MMLYADRKNGLKGRRTTRNYWLLLVYWTSICLWYYTDYLHEPTGIVRASEEVGLSMTGAGVGPCFYVDGTYSLRLGTLIIMR